MSALKTPLYYLNIIAIPVASLVNIYTPQKSAVKYSQNLHSKKRCHTAYRFLGEILPNFQFALTAQQMYSSIFSAVYLHELGVFFFSSQVNSSSRVMQTIEFCCVCVCFFARSQLPANAITWLFK